MFVFASPHLVVAAIASVSAIKELSADVLEVTVSVETAVREVKATDYEGIVSLRGSGDGDLRGGCDVSVSQSVVADGWSSNGVIGVEWRAGYGRIVRWWD